MTVYVDRDRNRFRYMVMSHMLADTVDELHAMADAIGLDRKHFQPRSTPHYDVSQTLRQRAIALGAVVADRHKVVALIRHYRSIKP